MECIFFLKAVSEISSGCTQIPEKKKAWNNAVDWTEGSKLLKGGCRGWLFEMVPGDRTKGSGPKLEHRRFPLKIKEALLCCMGDGAWGTGHLNRLPREAVESLSLMILKSCLDVVLVSQL